MKMQCMMSGLLLIAGIGSVAYANQRVEGALDSFLGEPAYDVQDMFQTDRFPTVAIAMDGTVLAVWNDVVLRRSEDGGETWAPEQRIAEGFMGGGVTVCETTGTIFAFLEEGHPPAPLSVYRSADHGNTWQEHTVVVEPNTLGHVPSMHMNEHGITLRHGPHKGRLIRPSRWYDEGNARQFWPNHYTNAVFSDDGGTTWQASEPFPEMGTGEACIVEVADGTLYYNTRRHWAPEPDDARNRWIAWSTDGGRTWTDHENSAMLPDGNTDTTYGLMGGLVRLPVKERDILIFSNIISDDGRKNGHVWASFDGGVTWPVKRVVEPGDFAYSSLNAGRPDTPSEGWIYLLYETGGHPDSSGRMARLNLSWILEGEATGDGELPAWISDAHATPAPARHFFVSPDGNDDNPGTETAPFQTLEQARDAIRAIKADGPLPTGGIVVNVMSGTYPVRDTFVLSEEDSGVPGAPIVYRGMGGDKPRFTGGVRLTDFSVLEHADTLARLPESARGHVLEADLEQAGVTELIPFKRGGFASGRGFKTHPEMELFVDGEPMTVAQWPNEGFVQTGEVPGPLTLVGWDNRPGAEHGRFYFDNERLARWADEPNGWLHGYWYWDWADSYEHIERIDVEKQKIYLAEPWHRYGYRKDQRFRAVNMLCELDTPGQWYLDHERKRAYLYPTRSLDEAVVELSVFDAPLMRIEGASHLRFEGLLWECGAADGVHVRGGTDCRITGCTIRKMAGNGLEIHGGRRHLVRSCDIHTMGRGGIVMNGGNRKTLEPGEHLIENCRISHLSRIDSTYTPGVLLGGVGNRIRNNLIHDVASSAFRIGGNDHIIERNEVHSVVLESDDQGGVDMWGDPTFRGIVFRHNYWHHLGNWQAKGEGASSERAAIRLDDAICGVLIEGNVFQRVCATPTWFGAVQIHGGKDNTIRRNLVLDSGAAVSFTPWTDERWREFVADAMDSDAIDRELYLERYPQLAQLKEGANEDVVRENVVIRCDTLFLREHDAVTAEDNRVYTESDLFLSEPGERLQWSAADAEAVGLADIPFDEIGLFDDEWRTSD